jgi:hypothetical protein
VGRAQGCKLMNSESTWPFPGSSMVENRLLDFTLTAELAPFNVVFAAEERGGWTQVDARDTLAVLWHLGCHKSLYLCNAEQGGNNENQTRKKLLSRIFPSIATLIKACESLGGPIGRSGRGTPVEVFLAEGVTGGFRPRFLVLQQPKIDFDS